jgi:hypothetical protein
MTKIFKYNFIRIGLYRVTDKYVIINPFQNMDDLAFYYIRQTIRHLSQNNE